MRLQPEINAETLLPFRRGRERARRGTIPDPDARRDRMDGEMTNPARNSRFLDQVEDSTQLSMGAK